MYSIVLMAAVGGSPTWPAADQPAAPVAAAPVVAGCTGCNGYAGYAAGCYGSCYGCSGSCHGRGGFLGHKARGGSCYGCSGASHWGAHHSGCYGACWGSCQGYGGACWGSCHGCGGGVYGSYFYPAYGAPPAVVIPVETPVKPMAKPEDKTGASVKFRLPAGANLFVDGRPTPGTGAERAFFTPPLTPGQRYFYDVKAEISVAGQTVIEEKRIVVSAGADVVESFPKLFAATGTGTTLAGK